MYEVRSRGDSGSDTHTLLEDNLMARLPWRLTASLLMASAGIAATAAAPALADPAAPGSLQSVTLNETGAPQIFTVPAGVGAINVDALGGNGGYGANNDVSINPVAAPHAGSAPVNASSPQGYRAPGGSGGEVQATVSVSPGDNLTATVAGNGQDGGEATSPPVPTALPYGIAADAPNLSTTAASGGYGGGADAGANSYRTISGSGAGGGATTLSDASGEIIVAGGGGGAGGDGPNGCNSTFTAPSSQGPTSPGAGGAGGANVAPDGVSANGQAGQAAVLNPNANPSIAQGGTGGSSDSPGGVNGAGVTGQSDDSSSDPGNIGGVGGGGGGGGLYGGGGGLFGLCDPSVGASGGGGGGGGSSYAGPAVGAGARPNAPINPVSNVTFTQGANVGATGGSLTYSYYVPLGTSTIAVAAPAPATTGQSLTLQATVTDSNNSPVSSGLVQFKIDGVNVGAPVSVSNGLAILPTTAPSAGSHHIEADYLGTLSNGTGPGYSPSSNTGSEVSNGALIPTSTAVVTTPTSASQGQTLTLQATVTDGSGSPVTAGQVQFTIDGVNVGSPVTVSSSGVATTQAPAPGSGAHHIVANYLGVPVNGPINGYAPSSGAAGEQTSAPPSAASTNTSVSFSSNPTKTSSPVTICASVSTSTGAPVSGGTVQFTLLSQNIGGPVSVVNGKACVATTSPAVAETVAVVANYSGVPASATSGGYLPSTGHGPLTTFAPAGQVAMACTTAQLTLIDVAEVNGHVDLLGAGSPALVGKRVRIYFTGTGHLVAQATIGRSGTFETSAPMPAHVWFKHPDKIRYRAVVGAYTSMRLKLERRMVQTSLSSAHGKVTMHGQVVAPFAPTPQWITITWRQSCHSTQVVARVKANASGFFTATFKAPKGATVTAAVYRAQTQVPQNTHNHRLFPTFSLPRVVAINR